MINHFLITRFNLKKKGWEKNKSDQEVLTEDWLRNRTRLFLNYCLPSVLGQSVKNFKWIICFQKGTEQDVRSLLETLHQYEFIEPIFFEGYDDFLLTIPFLVEGRLYNSPKFICTTRLDNDDAVHKDFLKEIQKQIPFTKHDTVIDFPNGLCLNLKGTSKLASQKHFLNQFVSLIERYDKKKGIKTVYINNHNNWGEKYNISTSIRKPLWLQITHEGNMLNEFKGQLTYSFKIKNFCIKTEKFKIQYDLLIFINKVNDFFLRNKVF